MPEPAPAPAPAPAPVQAAPRTDVGARVLVRLENGERIEVGAFDGFEAAKKRARELMAELGQAAEWPFLSGRYVRPEAITLLCPSSSSQAWVDELPDDFQEVRVEVHDPANRKRLSYLLTTQSVRRAVPSRE